MCVACCLYGIRSRPYKATHPVVCVRLAQYVCSTVRACIGTRASRIKLRIPLCVCGSRNIYVLQCVRVRYVNEGGASRSPREQSASVRRSVHNEAETIESSEICLVSVY